MKHQPMFHQALAFAFWLVRVAQCPPHDIWTHLNAIWLLMSFMLLLLLFLFLLQIGKTNSHMLHTMRFMPGVGPFSKWDALDLL